MKTKEQLISEYSQAAGVVSFYNAAEGDWHKEAEGRRRAYVNFKAICAECEAAGIAGDELPKGFLL